MKRTIMTTVVIAVAGLTLSGCSVASSTSQPTSTAVPVTTVVKNVKDLKIAYFPSGSTNSYLQVGVDEAKKIASNDGFKLDVFDGQFDPKIQFNQLQTAMTSGKYNAFVVMANDGNLVCNMLTKDAPKAGIMVSILNQPICGRATNAGEALWQPGTLTFVGGQTLGDYQDWVAQVIKDHPDGAKIALISGAEISANTINFHKAAEAFSKNPKFKIVSQQMLNDQSTPEAFAAAQTILQSNPDVDVIMSNYSGLSRGVVQATTGKKVQVYDFGGDQWSLDNVKSGVLASTVMMLPRTEVSEAINAVVETVEGKTVPHFIDLTKSSSLPGTPFVTKSTVSKFKAEY
jgi:ribose transport system substrate-binding protein